MGPGLTNPGCWRAIAGTLESGYLNLSFIAEISRYNQELLFSSLASWPAKAGLRTHNRISSPLSPAGAEGGEPTERRAQGEAHEPERRRQPAQRLQGGHGRPRREHDRYPDGVHRRVCPTSTRRLP